MVQNRRQFMRTGAATAGALTAGSLAGCGWVPFLGGAGYTEWIPDTDEFQENDGLFVFATKPSEIASNEDSYDGDYYDESLESEFEEFGVDFEDVTLNVQTIGGRFTLPLQVLQGEYDEGTVVDAIEDSETGAGEFAEDGEYEGYTVYLADGDDAPEDSEVAYGMDGTTVVRTSSSGDKDAEEMLELVVDTKNGDAARLTEESDDFSTLTDELGDGTRVFTNVRDEVQEESAPAEGSLEGTVASGTNQTVNGDTSDYKGVYVFDSEGDADEDDLQDYVDESLDDQFSPNDDPSVSVDGRLGIVEFSYDTDGLPANESS